MALREQQPTRPEQRRATAAPPPALHAAPESLTCALAATLLEETYRTLDETYAVLGLTRWNQPPAQALAQARTLRADPRPALR
ncbi:hypothetical protein ABT324_08205 [Saccharopolyspora sp. NPDC000359]|uniref:hypothetical protein n=1 Tax=Saccharopolyspora sp. NPDC000359 TaxID=3154251 RepID=UPI003321AAE3